MPSTIRLVDPDGVERDVAVEGAGSLLQDPRWRVATPPDDLGRIAAQASETDYGGVHGAIGAIGAGIARGATLGASDVASRAIGGDEAADTLRGLRAENPALSAGADIVGALAPALLTGGATLPAGAAGVAGRGAAMAAGGGIRGALAGGAVEGALFGAGQGVSELALSQDPLTLEHAATAIGSNALYGAGIGAVASGALKGVEYGLGSARRALDRALLARSEGRAMGAVADLEAEAAAHPPTIGPETDVATLDKGGLKAAEADEVARIDAARQPVRERFVELLDEAHRAREPDKEWLSIVADRNPDKYTRENAKVLFNVDRKIRNLLDNREGLVARPARATEWLQQERQALDGLIERGQGDLAKFREAADAAPDTVRKELRAGDLDGFKMGKGAIPPVIPPGSPIIDDIVAREVQARFPRDAAGALIVPKELAGFEDGRLQIALNRNRDLQQTIANLQRAPQSERLSQIEAAREALGGKTAPPKSEPESSAIGSVLKMAAHAVPFGGLAEKAAGALGGLRKAVGAGAERVQRAASTFLGKAAPVAGKAADLAPPVATKVLAALRYGEPATDERGKPADKPEPKTLPELYRARADEIRSQVQLAPDGTHQMRPAARAKMAARLSGLGAIDPIAADRLESAGAARIAWLASQLPRRPDLAGLPVGPDTWQPSDAAMRTWTRKAAAAEDPYGVLDRASAGAKARVVPEEIMAMRALQPALLNDYITKVIAGLPDRKERLPYPQRLSLSMLTGRPLDPAMTPIVLRELQSMHAGEPGTAGGTMAPRSTPQFGSVKRSDSGTPAQRRQGIGL